MLDAMDEEFGVSNLVDEQKDKEKRKKAREAVRLILLSSVKHELAL